jgi:hypothetical protein
MCGVAAGKQQNGQNQGSAERPADAYESPRHGFAHKWTPPRWMARYFFANRVKYHNSLPVTSYLRIAVLSRPTLTREYQPRSSQEGQCGNDGGGDEYRRANAAISFGILTCFVSVVRLRV